MELTIQKTYPIQVGRPTTVDVVLAGCGGTGSFLALHLARLAHHARRQAVDVQLVFVDPDVVEPGNLGRQNFCHAEVGMPKAEALGRRYAAAFGLPVTWYVETFDPSRARSPSRSRRADLCLVAGCVDNAAARQSLAAAVKWDGGRLWWLDCGNHEHAGQVLLGNRADLDAPEISPLGFCTGLPSPGVQHPELLQAPELDAGEGGPSCAELIAADAQSLMVNQMGAGWAASYVARLILARDLDLMATYYDLITGAARSVPITGDISPEI